MREDFGFISSHQQIILARVSMRIVRVLRWQKKFSWKLLEVFKFVLMIPHVIRIYFKFGEWEAIYSESSSMPSPSRGWVLFFMSSFRHIFPKTFGAVSSSLFLFLFFFKKKEFYTQNSSPQYRYKKGCPSGS